MIETKLLLTSGIWVMRQTICALLQMETGIRAKLAQTARSEGYVVEHLTFKSGRVAYRWRRPQFDGETPGDVRLLKDGGE